MCIFDPRVKLYQKIIDNQYRYEKNGKPSFDS